MPTSGVCLACAPIVEPRSTRGQQVGRTSLHTLRAVTGCPRCGYESAESFNFCPNCGLDLSGPRHEQRKVVTVLFSDIVGSTSLAETLDPEALRRLLRRFFDEVRSVVER